MSIHLLGIRHHGPGSCRNVLEYLQELKPDLILLEGPASRRMLCSIRSPNSLRSGRRYAMQCAMKCRCVSSICP